MIIPRELTFGVGIVGSQENVFFNRCWLKQKEDAQNNTPNYLTSESFTQNLNHDEASESLRFFQTSVFVYKSENIAAQLLCV